MSYMCVCVNAHVHLGCLTCTVLVQYWRIVDCTDDLAWALFYYAGAASAAGQSYSGAVLVSRDGTWPSRVLVDPAVNVLVVLLCWYLSHAWYIISRTRVCCSNYRNTASG